MAVYQMVGVARARPDPSGKLWAPDPAGAFAYITPVRTLDSLSPLSADPWASARFGQILDLIAWTPGEPRQLLRTGEASWLGSAPLPQIDPCAVQVWDSVLEWLREGAEGIVLLSSNPHDRQMVRLALDRPIVASAAQRRQEAADFAAMERRARPQFILRSGGLDG